MCRGKSCTSRDEPPGSERETLWRPLESLTTFRGIRFNDLNNFHRLINLLITSLSLSLQSFLCSSFYIRTQTCRSNQNQETETVYYSRLWINHLCFWGVYPLCFRVQPAINLDFDSLRSRPQKSTKLKEQKNRNKMINFWNKVEEKENHLYLLSGMLRKCITFLPGDNGNLFSIGSLFCFILEKNHDLQRSFAYRIFGYSKGRKTHKLNLK